MQVNDKAFVVTGGGNGIGRALVLGLLERGARVAAVDIRPESLEETATLADAGDLLSTHVLDITDREATAAFPDEVLAAHGSIDGLINCAGIIQPFVRFADLEWDAIDRVVDVNLYGTMHMLKAFLPILSERPVAHVVNVSSMGGFLPVPGQAVYGASKAAVKLLTEALYAELLESPVAISVVMPGGVGTDITTNSGVASPVDPPEAEESSIPMTTVERAAEIILDGMEDDKLHILVGRDATMMNLASRIAPRQATHLITRQMKDLLPS